MSLYGLAIGNSVNCEETYRYAINKSELSREIEKRSIWNLSSVFT